MKASEILNAKRAVDELHKRRTLEECRREGILTKAEIEVQAARALVAISDLSPQDALRVLAFAHSAVLSMLISVSRRRPKTKKPAPDKAEA